MRGQDFLPALFLFYFVMLTCMPLTEVFESGRVDGLGLPERVITAHLSKLYVFGTRIFKVYKHETYFFADLTNAGARKKFIAEDFWWNNAAAPEIYQHLWGIEAQENSFALVPHSEGQDLAIEMLVIDDSRTLTKLLLAGEYTPAYASECIRSLVDVLRELTRTQRPLLPALFKKHLSVIMKEDIGNLHEWMSHTKEIGHNETERFATALYGAIESEPYFVDASPEAYSAAIDANSDNLIVLNEKPSMIDILPPRESWRVVDEYATVARPIVDMEVHGAGEAARAAREAYVALASPLPERACIVHEARAAGIQWAYRYMLKQPELAEKYATHAMKLAGQLEKGL